MQLHASRVTHTSPRCDSSAASSACSWCNYPSRGRGSGRGEGGGGETERKFVMLRDALLIINASAVLCQSSSSHGELRETPAWSHTIVRVTHHAQLRAYASVYRVSSIESHYVDKLFVILRPGTIAIQKCVMNINVRIREKKRERERRTRWIALWG